LLTAIESWNSLAKDIGLPIVQRQGHTRLKALALRIEEAGGIDGWNACLAKVRDSPFLRGQVNGNGHENFRCTFDWLLKPANFTKIMEGNYDENRNHQEQRGAAGGFANAVAAARGVLDPEQ
jgi:hypothetical protein